MLSWPLLTSLLSVAGTALITDLRQRSMSEWSRPHLAVLRAGLRVNNGVSLIGTLLDSTDLNRPCLALTRGRLSFTHHACVKPPDTCMRAEDASFRTLLADSPPTAVHQIGAVRTIVTDTALIGFCRKAFIDAIGMGPTRRLILKLGYAQGWRLGGELIRLVEPVGRERFVPLVGRLLTHLGVAQPLVPLPDTASDALTLTHSCEADEHVRCCGPSREPVCWFVVGCVSGYLSRTAARAVVCREERCAGLQDAVCQLVFEIVDAPVNLSEPDPFSDTACLHLLKAFGEDVTPVPTLDSRNLPRMALGARSPRMQAIVALAQRAAHVDSTVLITGESGVGKERLARFIHEQSRRAKGPFMAINCGALPDTLLENELFGHRRGAFTGALDDRPGLFEAGEGGSIFLDEIGEMRLEMQVKLLRVLQEREVRRLGDTRCRRIDVRIIAATNRDLAVAVHDGRFREDLYYRLAVVPFHVPPLRERPDDLRSLADTLLDKIAHQMQRPIGGYTRRALDRLLAYHWPGNIRELENAIERACALSTGHFIDVDDLPEPVRAHASLLVTATTPVPRLWEIEREHILRVLHLNRGNRGRTAEQLGIGSKTLYRKLRQYQRHAENHETVGHNDLSRSK